MSWGECPVSLVFERIARHREGWPSGFLGAAHETKVGRVTVGRICQPLNSITRVPCGMRALPWPHTRLREREQGKSGKQVLARKEKLGGTMREASKQSSWDAHNDCCSSHGLEGAWAWHLKQKLGV